MADQFYSLKIDDEECLGCGNCVSACPLSNPESPLFRENERKIRLESGVAKNVGGIVCWEHPEISDDCEECTLFCPTEAIKRTVKYKVERHVGDDN